MTGGRWALWACLCAPLALMPVVKGLFKGAAVKGVAIHAAAPAFRHSDDTGRNALRHADTPAAPAAGTVETAAHAGAAASEHSTSSAERRLHASAEVQRAKSGLSAPDAATRQRWDALIDAVRSAPQEDTKPASRWQHGVAAAQKVGKLGSRTDFLLATPASAADMNRIFPKIVADARAVEQADAIVALFKPFEGQPIDSSVIAFKQRIAASPSDVAVIIGHNEDGMLRLPGGSSVSLKDMANACAEVGRPCVFLSCASEGYVGKTAIGVPYTITFDDAAAMSRLISAFQVHLASRDGTAAEFARILPAMLKLETAKIHAKVAFRYVAPATGAGAGLFMLAGGNKPSDPPKPRQRG